ncbi:hypothetical protein OHA17_40805 (plasmid) [Streptomyces sp. NBC_00212]
MFWFNVLSTYSGRTVADRLAGATVVNATYVETPAPPQYAAPAPGPYAPMHPQQAPAAPPYAAAPP